MNKWVFIALATLGVSACATGYNGPVYERASSQFDEGYSEVRLDDNRYRVQYRSENGDERLAQDWAIRRAAELTLDRRYDWFQIISHNNAYADDDFGRYDAMQYDRDRIGVRPQYDSRLDADAVAVMEVIMGNNPPPRSDSVYDARRVVDYTRDGRRY